MDALIRYHRMLGTTPTGVEPTTRHATQIVVERQLQAEGKTGTSRT